MNPHNPKDIRLDDPMFRALIRQQVDAIVKGDDRRRERTEAQLRATPSLQPVSG